MSMLSSHPEGDQDKQKSGLNRRLEDIGWALFLIMIGALWLMPAGQVPEGTWLIGAGLIMVGINAVRYSNGIRMSGFTLILGTVALAGGLADFLGVKLPLFPILLTLIGVSIILRPSTPAKSRRAGSRVIVRGFMLGQLRSGGVETRTTGPQRPEGFGVHAR
jgi:hypothetical protein